ncbi:hypothetical protein JCM21900_005276 [Sporobolomyces salmonicolor]
MSHPPSEVTGGPPRQKRPRTQGIDTSLIISSDRKRRRGDGSEETGPSTRHGGRASSPNPATVPATTPAEFEEVRKKSMILYDKLLAQRDPADPNRMLYYAFTELPSQEDYPDYYRMIKKPISLQEVKQKIDTLAYSCLLDAKTDMNQIFVNAKRYNAPGSTIFVDAKKLHKVLRSTYAVLAGEAPPPEEDDLPVAPTPSSAPAARALSATPAYIPSTGDTEGGVSSGTPVIYREGEIPGTAFAKRGPTLKPWLTKKLAETMAMADPTGRKYADQFRALPDKKEWPDYYQVITHPISLENIAAKVNKRAYQNVQQFRQDVEVCFQNAIYFNEEQSRIWKDAKIMLNHFTEVMKEQPPEFVPPRTYNTAKRRAEAEAAAAGLPSPFAKPKRATSTQPSQLANGETAGTPDYEYDDDSGDETDGRGSQPPFGGYTAPFDLPVHDLEEAADPFAIPGLGASRSLTPAATSPALGTAALPSAFATPTLSTFPAVPIAPAQQAGPAISSAALSSLAALAASTQLASPSPYQQPLPTGALPVLNGTANGAPASARPANARAPSSDAFKPKLVAKMPALGEVPLITRFSATFIPAASPITLDNALVRQHSLSVPPETGRIEFTASFRRASSTSKSKGKSRTSSEGDSDAVSPIVSISARPAGVSFEAITTIADQDTDTQAPPTRFALVPRKGLSVVQFVVTPRDAEREGEAEADQEVYRCFVTR